MKRYILALSCVLLAAGGALAKTAVAPVVEAYMEQRSGNFEKALAAFMRAVEADPASSEIRLATASLLGKLNRYDEALAVLDGDGSGGAAGRETLYLKARLFEAQGLLAEAAAEAEKAVEVEPEPETWRYLFELLTELDRFEEAETQAKLWQEAFPKDPNASFAVGNICAKNGDEEKARKYFQRALEIDPNHVPALRGLADLDFQEGDYGKARELYKMVIQINPHDIEAYYKLGQTFHKEGLLEKARDVFMAAGNLGMLMLQSDRFVEASEIYQVMALTQDDSLSWYFFGYSLLGQDKFDKALFAFEKVPEGTSHYQPALIRRAIALSALDRRDEAVELLESWIAENQGDEDAVMALSGLFEDAEEYRRAADVLEKLVDSHGSENPRLFFTLGVLYDKLKDWQSSADYMKRSLELSPNDAHVLNYLGYTYAVQGVNLEEAESLIIRALEIRTGDGFITDSLGWVYFKQGRYDKAVETLGRAVEIAPDDPVIWEHFGDALVKLGEAEKARNAYQKTLELKPEAEEARLKLEQLQ